MPLRSSAITLALLSTAQAAFAQADFQFRINDASPPLNFELTPPTIGLVTATGSDTDAMVFAWTSFRPAGLEALLCERVCGTTVVTELFGGSSPFAETLRLRRFLPNGAFIDSADQILTATVPNRNGHLEEPSIAVRPATGTLNDPFRLAWWDNWDWFSPSVKPCGGPDCERQPVGWWTLRYSTLLSPAPSSGTADFLSPAACRATNPSVAHAPATDIVAWRDVTQPCHRIIAGINGNFTLPPPPGPFALVIRDGAADTDVDRPCAAATQNGTDQFVVAWREDDLTNFSSSIMLRRISASGVLGDIVTVASFGQAAPGTGPAVSMFDDGSFVVQWVGFNNGDPPTTPLMAQVFDTSNPPGAVGGQVEVASFFDGLNHTITARGDTWENIPGQDNRITSVYETPFIDDSPGDLYARAIVPHSGELGEPVRVPELLPISSGNRIGEPHQHTALLRADRRVVVAWNNGTDGHNYATVRTVPLPFSCPCSADFDGSGGTPDAGDIDAFFNAWLAGDASADADCSGGTPDAGDIDLFFTQWLNGGC
jgi:hypothetical protein